MELFQFFFFFLLFKEFYFILFYIKLFGYFNLLLPSCACKNATFHIIHLKYKGMLHLKHSFICTYFFFVQLLCTYEQQANQSNSRVKVSHSVSHSFRCIQRIRSNFTFLNSASGLCGPF